MGNYPATQGPSGHTPYATGQGYTAWSNISAVAVSQFPSPVQGKQSLIVKKRKIDNPDRELTDDELLKYLEPNEEGNTNANPSPTASQNKPQVKHFKKEHTSTNPKGAPAKHESEHTNGNGGQSNGDKNDSGAPQKNPEINSGGGGQSNAPAKHGSEHTNGNGGQSNGGKNDSGAPQKNPEINSGDGGQSDNERNYGGMLEGNPNVGGDEKDDSYKNPGPASVKRQIFKT